MLHVLMLAAAMMLPPAAPNVPRPLDPLALSDAERHYLTHAPERRVRATTELLAWHVAEGLRRSPTFAAMMRALEDTDVIVHLVEATHLPPLTDAQTVFVTQVEGHRFLRVHLGLHRRGDGLIALLGHELMHALEIAGAPEVRDERALEALYRRIGHRGPRALQFDTQEARLMERRIHRELGTPAQRRGN